MSNLQLAAKARAIPLNNRVATLYRSMIRELPRVLAIYDIDIPVPEARNSVKNFFYSNASIKDARVVQALVEKGYLELEETLLQYKQRSHLERTFEGYINQNYGARKILPVDATVEEQLLRD